MSSQTDLSVLFDLVDKLLIFLGRTDVQIQLLAIAVAVIGAWFVARLLWAFIAKRLPAWEEIDLSNRMQRYRQRLLISVNYLIYPVLIIGTGAIARAVVGASGTFIGLIETFIALAWFFLFYRLFLTFLYVLFDYDIVRRYHNRLLTPLFVVYIIFLILNELTDLDSLANGVVTTLFDSPITLGALFLATVGLYMWLTAAVGLQEVSYRLITSRTRSDPGAVEATLTLIRYLLIVIGVMIVISNLNFNTATVAAITGGLSVGIGFALREVLSNFISGIFLLFEGSLHPGDVIDIEGEISVVKRLNIRATRVQTLNNVEVVIPNQTFFTSSFTTYTGSNRQIRILIPVGASYNNDPEQVIKILEEVGLDHPEVLRLPKPMAMLTGFGDSSVDFSLAVWINDPTRLKPVTSELNRAIWKAFASHDIEIPFHQQDLHLRSGVPWEKLSA